MSVITFICVSPLETNFTYFTKKFYVFAKDSVGKVNRRVTSTEVYFVLTIT